MLLAVIECVIREALMVLFALKGVYLNDVHNQGISMRIVFLGTLDAEVSTKDISVNSTIFLALEQGVKPARDTDNRLFLRKMRTSQAAMSMNDHLPNVGNREMTAEALVISHNLLHEW